MKVIILIYIQTICSLLAFEQLQDKVPDLEIKEIFRLAIDLPELQQFYHVDVDSTRIPLVRNIFWFMLLDNYP
jgi:hypothetical protein